MAIKGKSRSRGGARASARAPAPKRVERPLPPLARPGPRRVLVVLLSVLTVAGGARVWLNASRSDAFRTYLRDFAAAQRAAAAHLSPGTETSMHDTARAFTKSETTTADLKRLAERWEQDFKAAETRLGALAPPAELTTAHKAIVEGLGMYAGVARLYHLAAQQREIAARAPAAARQPIEDKVQVTLIQAGEWAERAQDVYGVGGARIEDLRVEWLGLDRSRRIVGIPEGFPIPPSSPTPSPTPGATAGATVRTTPAG